MADHPRPLARKRLGPVRRFDRSALANPTTTAAAGTVLVGLDLRGLLRRVRTALVDIARNPPGPVPAGKGRGT